LEPSQKRAQACVAERSGFVHTRAMNRLLFGDDLQWLRDKDFPKVQILAIEGLLSGTERVEPPLQMNPFAKPQRESKVEQQPEML
jgi:hypothetical protein